MAAAASGHLFTDNTQGPTPREGVPRGQQQDPQEPVGTDTTELALCWQESHHTYLFTASFGLGAHTALLWLLS